MNVQLRDFTYFVAVSIMIGWLLHIGKPVLLPVLIAMIVVYVLSAAAQRMQSIPGFARRALVLFLFAIGMLLLFSHIVDSFTKVAQALPKYESNLEGLVTQSARIMGIENEPTWETIRQSTIDRLNVQQIVTPVLYSLQGLGGMLFLVVLYASFSMAERARMPAKLTQALGDQDRGARTLDLLRRINTRVGEYLSVKTVVNVILAGLSYGVMLPFGLEFALFWAILIGFLNYIPYIGSMVAVIFPVLLGLAQFGDLGTAALLALGLTAAQMFVAGVLEPRMMGRAFNLSPFVVLFALAFWSALWGIPGAVLAVPLTASLIIVLGEINATRPIAIMLSASGRI